ncbi:MAG: glucosidase, partial [Bacteroidota bacterium]|nr:glucosidase [Bacteroidota bacterium]
MNQKSSSSAEHQRLIENLSKNIPLEQWGPYLSERQWGTVREDYGYFGDAWNYFPYDQAHYRSYIWGEDGIAGISDFFQSLCFAVTLWNRKDPILKERLFGLGNNEGNHGEDVKELYYYLDNIPTHYYMEYLYKYPQQEFPYEKIRSENRKRSKMDPEYEILDTGVFDNNEYFDVHITYAKQDSQDLFIRIKIQNRADKPAGITVLPTLWFYNRKRYKEGSVKPIIEDYNKTTVKATHHRLGTYYFYFEKTRATFYTENETNMQRVNGKPNPTPFVKDAFHEGIIRRKNVKSLRKSISGTKFAPIYNYTIDGGGEKVLYLRLSNKELNNAFEPGFENIFATRKAEADVFYETILPSKITPELRNIQRQALAGMLWSKQYYHYDVERWLTTSDGITPVNDGKLYGRNHEWKHLKNQNIIMMPD